MTEGQLSEMRAALYEEIDRMTEDELVGLKEFIATYPDRLGAVLRNAPEMTNRKLKRSGDQSPRQRNGSSRTVEWAFLTNKSCGNSALNDLDPASGVESGSRSHSGRVGPIS